MNEQEKDKALSNAYDIIAAIWSRQDGVVPFDLCYGDGTRFKGLTKKAVYMVWHIMDEMLRNGAEGRFSPDIDSIAAGEGV